LETTAVPVDTNGDGVHDAIGYDTTGDGQLDALDESCNGIIDTITGPSNAEVGTAAATLLFETEVLQAFRACDTQRNLLVNDKNVPVMQETLSSVVLLSARKSRARGGLSMSHFKVHLLLTAVTTWLTEHLTNSSLPFFVAHIVCSLDAQFREIVLQHTPGHAETVSPFAFKMYHAAVGRPARLHRGSGSRR
jgi:hypothetical protein